MFDFNRYETKECLFLGGLFSGIGTAVGSAVSAGTQAAINQQNIDYDKEVRAEEHTRNLEKMAEQTRLNKEQFDHEFATESAWNNESAQRARMEAAGLNPALMYGTGASGSQVNASIGSTSISSGPGGPGAIAKSPDLSGLSTAVTDTMLAMSQKRVQDANANKINSEVADSTPVAEGERPTPGQLAYMQMQENLMSERYGNSLKAIEVEIANDTKGDKKDTIKQNLVNLRQQLVNDKELTQSMVANYNALAQKYGEETIDLKETRASRIALNKAKTETEGTQQLLNDSLLRLNSANADEKEFDNIIRDVTGYKPGWNIWQMLAGIYNKSIYNLAPDSPLRNRLEAVPDSVREDVSQWYNHLPEDKQKKLIEKFAELE